mmetsp:Transcript_84652/g.202902  ORF Transcript_84652/g.202902 Transcript_84652/m.202902 type:complete len:88 (+) Transcript_84652:64-327(+)
MPSPLSTYERRQVVAVDQGDYHGDDLKAVRLRAYKNASSAWPARPEDSFYLEQRRQARLFRDRFNPDFFYLRPSLAGGPESDAIQKK